MAKVVSKDYLLTQLRNMDSVVLENKYLQIANAGQYENVIESVKVNGSALTPDSNKAVDVTVPILGVQVNGSDLTPDSNKKVNVEIPAAVSYKIAAQGTPETGYLATYTLQANTGTAGAYEDVTGAAKINIPKDFLVKSVSIETCETADSPVSGYAVGDKYIDFVVNTKDAVDGTGATHLYIKVADLVDAYTEGNGIDITNNEISVVGNSNAGIVVDSNGVAINITANAGLKFNSSTGALEVDFESTNIDFATEWTPASTGD